MIVMWGEKLYGKVDVVPGLFYVATRFAYLNFIPLIPLGSVLVLDKALTGRDDFGVKVGFSFKSFLMCYTRAALLVVAFVTGIIAASNLSDRKARIDRKGRQVAAVPRDEHAALINAGTCVACIAAWVASHYAMRASHTRALQLAEVAGVSEDLVNAKFGGREPPPRTTAHADFDAHAAADHRDDVMRLE